ncbi:DUF4833 domain-containing protein [Arsenicibacter rosenii]|uniref:DUF4833 domain-containing protein n=1 Tax=Arsenicibacter rosenii TaxID=1750698 RepID=A0A1S2VLT7_9BACT|nr:DUF4833 domain-containing protein [Arsenicibacter rosenii]OIN59185.1 hypothetical protein BLX24_09325 [Arsenicibacter rosenii]
MRISYFLIVLTGLLGHSFARADRDDFPVPPSSASRLFYIQRSNNTNTVIYDANMLADKKLDPRKPVSVYWIRYAEKGQQEGLSFFQWKMAYGYKHRPLNGADGFEFSLNAFDKRPIRITNERGRAMAMMQINGRLAQLYKVFVQIAPGNHLVPDVQYIELFGVDTDGNHPVYERIMI